jgi:hypothetical protein
MLKPLSLLLIGTTSVLFPLASQGMGFGELRGSALLNRPLSFAARVHLEPDEVLEAGCVQAEVLAGDERLGPDQIRISFPQGVTSGDRMVLVSTTRRMDEPVVTVTLTLGCVSKMSRKFVLFLDPPALNLASTSSSDMPAQPEAQPSAASASRFEATAPASSASPARRAPADRPVRTGRSSAVADSGSATRIASAAPAVQKAARAKPRIAARPTGGGPRLQLEAMPSAASAKRREATDPKSEASSQLAAAAVAATPAAAPASAAAASGGAPSEIEILRAELEKERQRSREFESTLARLQKQQSGAQQAIVDLQSRLRQPVGGRDPAQLVYVLGAFCALLTLLLVFLLWRRPRSSYSRWWDASRQAPVTDVGPETQPRLDSRHPKVDPPWLREAPAVVHHGGGFRGAGGDSSIGGLEVTAVPDHALLFEMRGEERDKGSAAIPSIPGTGKPRQGEPEHTTRAVAKFGDQKVDGVSPLESTMPFPVAHGIPALDLDLSLEAGRPSEPRQLT